MIDNFIKTLNSSTIFKGINDMTLLFTTYNRADMLIDDIIKGYKLGDQKKLIVDDFSSESDRKKLQSFLEKKETYKIEKIIFNNLNRGVGASVKIGIDNIKTKYTCICGDDDRLICLDPGELENEIMKVDSNFAFVLPRYIINIDVNENFSIGYDRKIFESLNGLQVLNYIFKTGELKGLEAGMISKTDALKLCTPEPVFRFACDHVIIARFLSNYTDKKIKISNSFVYIRRIWKKTLTRQLSKEKLSIHLLTLLVSGYYCLLNKSITKKELLAYLSRRGRLLQKLYGFGNDFVYLSTDYLTKKITLNKFVDEARGAYIPELSIENIPKEIIDILNLI